MKVFDLQNTQNVLKVSATGQSSLALAHLAGTCGMDQRTLTVDTRGAVALLTVNTKFSTASEEISSPSTSSRCVASSRSFAV